MKIIISGYGRMGHVVEKVLAKRGITLQCATEDVCAVPDDDHLDVDTLLFEHAGDGPAQLCRPIAHRQQHTGELQLLFTSALGNGWLLPRRGPY